MQPSFRLNAFYFRVSSKQNLTLLKIPSSAGERSSDELEELENSLPGVASSKSADGVE